MVFSDPVQPYEHFDENPFDFWYFVYFGQLGVNCEVPLRFIKNGRKNQIQRTKNMRYK